METNNLLVATLSFNQRRLFNLLQFQLRSESGRHVAFMGSPFLLLFKYRLILVYHIGYEQNASK